MFAQDYLWGLIKGEVSKKVVDIRKERRKEILETVGWEQFLMPVRSTAGRAVLLHGYDDDNTTLDPIKDELKNRRFSYVAPDLPGHGFSANGSPGHFEDILEHELVAHSLTLYLLKSLEGRRKKVVLVGYSMGAIVILSLLINHPMLRNCVAGVVLISTPLEVRQNSVALIRNMHFLLKIARRSYGRAVPPEFLFCKKLRNKKRPQGIADDTPFNARPTVAVIDELLTCSFYVQENIHRLEHIPMCAIHGTKDPKADFGTAERSFEKLKNAQFFALDGLAHYPWKTEYESEVVQLACDWMQERTETRRNS